MTRIRPLLVLGAGVCALVAIFTSSLDHDAYFYYRHRPHPPFEHPTGLVLVVMIATVAETGLAYAVYAKRRVAPLWKPASLALLALVPWGMLFSGWVIHAPRFWLLHLLWVWLMIAALMLTALLSVSTAGYRAFCTRGRMTEGAVEQ